MTTQVGTVFQSVDIVVVIVVIVVVVLFASQSQIRLGTAIPSGIKSKN